ncbi:MULTISPECIES: D-aminoacyl-tRNA deacylase [Enterococcus]|uniref:D-aminoacyl-tRNA deacylase n=1 Tax=Enterococcus mundtii TaxID=53346 RepID=A0A1V2UH90_ENTMU|nr:MULTISPECIES: D-aminoacyl-tRNA deacylase [Enterococcus]EOH65696.1 D-tyrosyl-tRNA(Tyr) deacylase [Enterococcus mundtii ATCC 882]EOU13786.1 D-tyrosyl-tRNA(Tyr) deacylase [Enterococcus mundtii ATCC 882]MBE9910222.1 D-tyrosyl-tRNA(Tyr) deacylase [Enterococcus mundtii]MCA6773830.1 D-tyrosyl-tRNA(Tyr) deacylase [Enterococcus mundtii]MRI74915.1 D-tyrosyl-tRNA(Tyr) deacylase [Enterococcus mundtii]
MRAVIQRVSQAAVSINEREVGRIDHGLLILLGVHDTDTQKDVDYLIKKIAQMRIFEDEQGKMNLSIEDVKGALLSISQFTLFADTKKGNRPSFIAAARPETAIPLYEAFNEGLRQRGITVETGEFGADMAVSLVNDGPVTIIIDSQNK